MKNLYGMTETSGAYVYTRPDDDVSVRYNTVGRPIDDVETRIWDDERGMLPHDENVQTPTHDLIIEMIRGIEDIRCGNKENLLPKYYDSRKI